MARPKNRGHRNRKPVKRRDSKLAARSGKQRKTPRASAKSRDINLADDDDADVLEVKGTAKDGMTETPTNLPAPRGRGDSGGLLTDPNRVRSDIRLVEQSVRKGWNVRRKNMIRRRLEDIVVKTEAEVVCKGGTVILESAADKLSIDAAKVLTAMDAADVNRVKAAHEKDNPILPQPTSVTNVININDESQRRRIELAQLASRLGAREIVLEGRSVPVTEILGAAVPVRDEEAEVPASGKNANSAASKASRVLGFDM